MNASVDPLLREEVRSLLETGEVLFWADRPDPFRFARARIVQALFGVLFFLLMALAAYAGSAVSGGTVKAGLLSLSFRPAALTAGVLLMVYTMLLPVLAYRKALKTVFVATDRRVLTLTGGHSVQSMRYSDMQAPVLELLAEGTADIRFRRAGTDDGAASATRQLHFRGVREAEGLHRMVLKRLSSSMDSGIAYGAVMDYIDMLARGKRTLDDGTFRE